MGYNYDIRFILRHQDTVNKLIKAWQDGEVLKIVSDNPSDLNYWQKLIRNLLASIEYNYVNCTGIRQQRTWMVRDTKENNWKLYVGRTTDKILGRPPTDGRSDSGPNLESVSSAPQKVQRVLDSARYNVEITSASDLAGLTDFILRESSKNTKAIEAHGLLVPTREAHSWFFSILDTQGWSMHIEPTEGSSKSRLVFEKVNRVEQSDVDEILKQYEIQ